MAWAPALIAGLGGLGGLFGNRKQTQQQTSRFNNLNRSNISGSQTGQVHTELNPLAGAGYNTLAAQYQKMLGQDPDLKGYEANQFSDINRQSSQLGETQQGLLASRGITGPAALNAQTGLDNQAFAQKIGIHNQIPLLAQQMQQNLMGQAGGFFNSIPTDTYTTGYTSGASEENQTGESTGTQTNPGNMLGGLFGGMGNLLAFLYGRGAFGGAKQATT